MTNEIEQLVGSLGERPLELEEALRGLLRRDQATFRNSALEIARLHVNDSKHAGLIQFLSRIHLLAAAVADPSECSIDCAQRLVRAAAAAGTPIETELASLLGAQLAAGTADGRTAGRILQILAILHTLDRGHCVLPYQAELGAYPDPRVRAKAALLIVRATRNVGWVASRLLKDDPRAQAEAVEALWGIDDDDCRGVLKMAAGSPHSRVAAAGMAGFHLIGDPSAIPKLLQLGQHPSEEARANATWAMGQTADPRFLPSLTACFASAGPGLRPAVLRALTRIRRHVRAWSEAGEMVLAIGAQMAENNGAGKLELSLWSSAAEDASSLPATQFSLWEGTTLVTDYALTNQTNPSLLTVGFTMPRIVSRADPYADCAERSLNGCLRLKRKCDLWCIDRYSTEQTERALAEPTGLCVPLPADPVLAPHFKKHHGFVSDPELIRKVWSGPVPRDRAARDPAAGLRRVFESISRLASARHVFVLMDPEAAEVSSLRLEELVRRAEDYTIAVHGFVAGSECRAAPLTDFCRATPGGSVTAAPPDRLPELMAHAYRCLLNRYEITFRTTQPQGRVTELKVCSPLGCAEIAIP